MMNSYENMRKLKIKMGSQNPQPRDSVMTQRMRDAMKQQPPPPQPKAVREEISLEDYGTNPVVKNSRVPFDEAHPKSLVIQCSDGRYTNIVSELMKTHNIDRYDVLAMPGGPALLDMVSASILQSEACRSGTSFLIKGHRTNRIFLLAHAGCGYYGYSLNGMSPKSIVARQVCDLQRAASWLRGINSSLEISATYIEHDKGIAIFRGIEVE
jgi:hypothetical protein